MNEKETSSKRIYRQPINYENGIILPLIRDICTARSTNPKKYQTDVQTLALILPKELRKKAFEFFKDETIREDLTMDGKKDFDDYWVYELRLLEEHGICFPKISYREGTL